MIFLLLPTTSVSITIGDASLRGESFLFVLRAASDRGDGRFDAANNDCRGARDGGEDGMRDDGNEEEQADRSRREVFKWLQLLLLIDSGVLGGSVLLVSDDGVLFLDELGSFPRRFTVDPVKGGEKKFAAYRVRGVLWLREKRVGVIVLSSVVLVEEEEELRRNRVSCRRRRRDVNDDGVIAEEERATGVPSTRACSFFVLLGGRGGAAAFSLDLRRSSRIRRAKGDAVTMASRFRGDETLAYIAAFLSCDIVMTRLLFAGAGEESDVFPTPPPCLCFVSKII
jgi:hypothetical protein